MNISVFFRKNEQYKIKILLAQNMMYKTNQRKEIRNRGRRERGGGGEGEGRRGGEVKWRTERGEGEKRRGRDEDTFVLLMILSMMSGVKIC